MPKYRGFSIEVGYKWVNGSLMTVENRCFILSSAYITKFGNVKYRQTEVYTESAGQFVTTQNGIDIFENDIVKGNWNIIGFIYFDTDFLQFRIKLMNKQSRELDFFGKLEVIGNVFENPELLEAKK